MLPWWYKTQTYNNYWRMNNGIYSYKVLFYEKDNDPYSCKDKFPLLLSDNYLITKDDFINIVKEAFNQINNLGFGLTFNCIGYDSTDTDIAFNMSDNDNTLVYYWNWNYGGLSAPFSKTGFGIKLDLINKGRKEWYIGCIRHEMTHVLGFAHKGIKNPFKNTSIIEGYKIKKEMTEDTIHGIDTIYNINTPYKIYGNVTDKNLYEFGEAYLIDWKNKLIRYQAPIDSNCYFEFRLRKRIRKFKVLVCSKESNYLYGETIRFNETHGKCLTLSNKYADIDLGEIKLINGAKNWEDALKVIVL